MSTTHAPASRLGAVGLAAGLLVVLSASGASAGEVTGSGKPITSIKDHVPASSCSFSGLDDVDEDETPQTDDFGRVQSFGQIVKLAGPLGGVPGFACNPTRSMDG